MKQKIVILGAAESGIGAALLAASRGFAVWVSDMGSIADEHKISLKNAGIEYEEQMHTEHKILDAVEVVKSPGIPNHAAIIQKIKAASIPLISEIEFAYRYKGESKILAVTGSNGKTTTTSLLYDICKLGGLDVSIVGNIGYSFARQVALQPTAVYVLEISSFQLDDIKTFRPDVAIITNITEDHLDRYDYNIQNYIDSKFKIAANQTSNDILIYNLDDEQTTSNIHKYQLQSIQAPITMSKELNEGAFLTNAELHMKWKGEEMKMSVDDFALKGKHNQYNGMAASLAAMAVGIRKERIRESLQNFETLEHRMEPVATVKGISFINDSKATNVNSTWYALESMTQPVVLILGGIDKGNDYDSLKDIVQEKVKAIVCMGLDNTRIMEAFKNTTAVMISTASITEAVAAAYHFAEKGDAVLLSPACASFDLFKNYEDRGKQFKEAVKNL